MREGSESAGRCVEKLLKALLIILCFSVVWAFLCVNAFASGKWEGVDESVVERVAKEHGREASKPFINTDQGDLLLFVFLLAGAAGGFAAGYYWRVLTERKSGRVGDP